MISHGSVLVKALNITVPAVVHGLFGGDEMPEVRWAETAIYIGAV